MKTQCIKHAAYLILFATCTATASAQAKTTTQKKSYQGYSTSKDAKGKTKENARITIDGTAYELEMLNEKVISLYVDGKLVPPDQYGQYETVLTKIKEQMRIDKIQAEKDHEQAMKDQQQAKKDQQQSKLDQEQAMRDQKLAKLDAERANKDQQQVKISQEKAMKDQQQAKLDHERAMKDQETAKLDMERASKDLQQAKLDQEQAMKDMEQAKKDQVQAKLDEEQAIEDERQLKNMIADIVKDGIVPNEKSLVSVSMSSAGMFVNDKKQPDNVYNKYKEKYSRFATGNFNYNISPNGNKSIQMHRLDKN